MKGNEMAEQETGVHWSASDIEEIRQRWAGAQWRYYEGHMFIGGVMIALIADSGDTYVGKSSSTEGQRELLKLAAQAPEDVRMLLARIATLEAEQAAMLTSLETYFNSFQEGADRLAQLQNDLPADTTAHQLEQVRDGVLVWRGDHWEMPPA